jgi:hypothetical protein
MMCTFFFFLPAVEMALQMVMLENLNAFGHLEAAGKP